MDGNPRNERSLYRNDVHGALNPSRHTRVFAPGSDEQVAQLLQQAQQEGQRLAIVGGQHAMGGQQFADGAWLLDCANLAGVLDFDADAGRVQVGAGTRWPQLQRFLAVRRDAGGHGWAIRQKQTGADAFTLGGSLAANIHGRGLDHAPFAADIESFNLVTPDGLTRLVDREREPELFALAIGGYGLFGVVTDLTLRLERRQMLQRRVQLLRRHELADAFAQARSNGARFGDFQFAVDPLGADFLDHGVFACYYPVHTPEEAEPAAPSLALDAEQWRELLWLAHVDKSEAFRRYSAFYLATDGQRYGSDDHQFGVYLDGYHRDIDARLGHFGSELITELYVPLNSLDAFLGALGELCRRDRIDVIYGTVRLIREDRDTVLAWARQDWACVVLNVHVRHDPAGLARARSEQRALIDVALGFGGSFYLTYHRHARADQLRAAYPRIDEFMRMKRHYDRHEVLASDWYLALRQTLDSP